MFSPGFAIAMSIWTKSIRLTTASLPKTAGQDARRRNVLRIKKRFWIGSEASLQENPLTTNRRSLPSRSLTRCYPRGQANRQRKERATWKMLSPGFGKMVQMSWKTHHLLQSQAMCDLCPGRGRTNCLMMTSWTGPDNRTIGLRVCRMKISPLTSPVN